jgi:acyl-CoA thioester hydrolase
VDGQGVVFNAHYLLYCDEALTLFCREHGLGDLAERVQLKASKLVWTSGARWGETVSVDAHCTSVGTSSFVLHFEISADGRQCCTVETTYVRSADGHAIALNDDERARLQPNS